METSWLPLVILGAYAFCGVFVTLVMATIVDLEGGDIDAEALTTISIFWPFVMPDLMFRLVMRRWFGDNTHRRRRL